ncbi:MAG: hypothetical protein ACYC2T_06105 [Bacillota bacterium]
MKGVIKSSVFNNIRGKENADGNGRAAARAICQWSPLVTRYAKDCILEVTEDPLYPVATADQYRNFTLYSSQDREEGHKAFVQKRDPDYRGK